MGRGAGAPEASEFIKMLAKNQLKPAIFENSDKLFRDCDFQKPVLIGIKMDFWNSSVDLKVIMKLRKILLVWAKFELWSDIFWESS